jgi:DNA-binding CsgD family transcriptional regulator/PAS domain-containing protein
MTGISPQVLRQRAIESIYDAVLEPERLPEAIHAIGAATGSMGGMLGIFDTENGQGHAPAIAGLDPQLLVLFEERYGLNLWTDAIRRYAKVGVPISSEPVVDTRELRATEFHDAILAPQDIVAQSFTLLRRDGRFTIGLTMMHTRPGHSADPDVLQCQGELGAHVAKAVDLMRRLDTLQSRLETGEVALEHHRCAVFVLDASAMIRFANTQARRLLAEGDGLLSVGRWLTARHNGDDAHLAQAIARAASADDAGRCIATVPIRRDVGRLPLLAMVVPGSERRHVVDLPGMPSEALVFVADPSERGTVAADLLAAAFGLTDREVSVALATVRQGGLPAAAAELGIAPTTARTHLQRVFDKTGTRHQVALAQLLASMDSLPGAAAGLQG